MTSRERVFTAINHQEPDRPPVFVTLTPQVAKQLSEYFGIPYETPIDSLLSTRISHTRLLSYMGNDCVGIAACAPDDHPSTTDKDGIITNEWGMKFRNAGLYNEFYTYPLAHATLPDDINRYSFPDPFGTGRFRHATETIRNYKESHTIVADLETVIFETSWYLTGLEKFLVDLISDAPYMEVLLDRVMEINVETGKYLIKLGSDILWAGDDFGTQHGMIMDPYLWRKVFKPRIKWMFEEFRKVNPDIKLAWHSCGSIPEIIPDFIEIGLDILNPIQPRARGMEPDFLKKEYGKDLVFFGGIDIQDLIPRSTPERINNEIKKICGILGKGGGYILAPAHNIQPDTPVENILAIYEAVKEV